MEAIQDPEGGNILNVRLDQGWGEAHSSANPPWVGYLLLQLLPAVPTQSRQSTPKEQRGEFGECRGRGGESCLSQWYGQEGRCLNTGGKRSLLISRHVLRVSANRLDEDGHSAARSGMPVDPLVHCHGLSNKLLRYMVTNLDRTGVIASANPYDQLVHMNPEWIDRFQVVYLSALRARGGWCHGAPPIVHSNSVRRLYVSGFVLNAGRCLSICRVGVCPMV